MRYVAKASRRTLSPDTPTCLYRSFWACPNTLLVSFQSIPPIFLYGSSHASSAANLGIRKERFKRNHFFDYAALKEDMLGFPMRIFLARGQLGRDKEDLFVAMVDDIKKHITTMKKIEDDQKRLNKKFPEMLEAVEKLRARNSGEMILKNKTPDLPNQIVPYRNAIRRLSKQL